MMDSMAEAFIEHYINATDSFYLLSSLGLPCDLGSILYIILMRKPKVTLTVCYTTRE